MNHPPNAQIGADSELYRLAAGIGFTPFVDNNTTWLPCHFATDSENSKNRPKNYFICNHRQIGRVDDLT
jgi:hypothetical protein